MIITILWIIEVILFVARIFFGGLMGQTLRSRYPNVPRAIGWTGALNKLTGPQIPSAGEITAIKSDPQLILLGKVSQIILWFLLTDTVFLVIFSGIFKK